MKKGMPIYSNISRRKEYILMERIKGDGEIAF